MSTHAPIVARSLVQETTERIEAAILDGTIPLGSAIKEQQIARSLGVSRGPLREALRTLEGRNLIVRTPNRPPRVVEMTASGMEDILIMREALEGACARLCAQKATDADLEDLARLAGMRQSEDEPYSFDNDISFHRRILTIADNARIADLLNGELYYLLKVYRLKSKKTPGRAEEALAEHRDIVTALQRRDPDEAEAVMRQHIINSRNNILSHLK